MKKAGGNLKYIREIYGATQEEIAKAINVNRATVSQWETGALIASNTNLEKLSIFYGVGPECFYEMDSIDEERRQMIVAVAKQAKLIAEKSNGTRNKSEDFNATFSNTNFKDAMRNYMNAMKLMLALADDGELDDLKLACQINEKMGTRLKAFVKIREEEECEKENNNNDTMFDILGSFTNVG